MPNFSIARGTPVSNSTTTAVAGATLVAATLSAVSGRINYVTDISFSTDLKGAVVALKDANNGTLWQVIAANTSQPFVVGFNSPLPGSANSNVVLSVPSTVTATANIGGYVL